MESPSERKVSEALGNMTTAEQLLINAIGEFGNEKIQNALLKYQDAKKNYYVASMGRMIAQLEEKTGNKVEHISHPYDYSK